MAQISPFTPGAAGALRLSGDLTVDTAAQLQREGRRWIGQAGALVTLDLAGIRRADSAGLALLIDWLAWAKSRRLQLHYTNLPEAVVALARLSEVTALLQ